MTAREPSAVEVITEALRAHGRRPSLARGVERCFCGESSVGEPGWFNRHQVEAVLAAIRAMSPTEQAELIGGDVGHIDLTRDGPKRYEWARGPWREVQP